MGKFKKKFDEFEEFRPLLFLPFSLALEVSISESTKLSREDDLEIDDALLSFSMLSISSSKSSSLKSVLKVLLNIFLGN